MLRTHPLAVTEWRVPLSGGHGDDCESLGFQDSSHDRMCFYGVFPPRPITPRFALSLDVLCSFSWEHVESSSN